MVWATKHPQKTPRNSSCLIKANSCADNSRSIRTHCGWFTSVSPVRMEPRLCGNCAENQWFFIRASFWHQYCIILPSFYHSCIIIALFFASFWLDPFSCRLLCLGIDHFSCLLLCLGIDLFSCLLLCAKQKQTHMSCNSSCKC